MWPEAQQSKSCPVTNLGRNEKKASRNWILHNLMVESSNAAWHCLKLVFFCSRFKAKCGDYFHLLAGGVFWSGDTLCICVKCIFDNLDHLHIILYKTYRSYHVTFVFTHEPSPFPLARQPTWRPSPLALKCLVVQAVPGQGKPPLNHHFWGIIIYPPWN